MDARSVTHALGGRWTGRNGIACCPAHDDQSPSLSLADGQSGQLLLTCHAGCVLQDVMTALRDRGILEGSTTFAPVSCEIIKQRRIAAQRYEERRARIARQLWEDARPALNTPAERYFRQRGITCALPTTLRYVAECWHPTAKRLPAVVAHVTGSVVAAIHRTYLSASGTRKADVAPNKAMLGSTKGGAVQLSQTPGRLVVTEGIETGLSLLSGLLPDPARVWAALSASGMASLALPRRPSELVIAPDGDLVGKQAARDLAERAHALGWHVSLMSPPDGYDWNDVLTGKVAL